MKWAILCSASICAVGISMTTRSLAQDAEKPDEEKKEATKSDEKKGETAARSAMDNQRLGELLKKRVKEIEGRPGMWRGKIGKREVIVLTDERANRMRIMSPIKKMDKKDLELCLRLLEANFDRALDAKYAVNGEILWSVFVHPLKSLTEENLNNALLQVVTLAENTGTTYSSGGVQFGGEGDDEKPDSKDEAEA